MKTASTNYTYFDGIAGGVEKFLSENKLALPSTQLCRVGGAVTGCIAACTTYNLTNLAWTYFPYTMGCSSVLFVPAVFAAMITYDSYIFTKITHIIVNEAINRSTTSTNNVSKKIFNMKEFLKKSKPQWVKDVGVEVDNSLLLNLTRLPTGKLHEFLELFS